MRASEMLSNSASWDIGHPPVLDPSVQRQRRQKLLVHITRRRRHVHALAHAASRPCTGLSGKQYSIGFLRPIGTQIANVRMPAITVSGVRRSRFYPGLILWLFESETHGIGSTG